MFDINLKNVKNQRIYNSKYIFLVIFVGVFISNIIKLNSLNSEILSTIVEVKSHINDEGNTMYVSVYYYEVNEQNYSCGPISLSSNHHGTKKCLL